MSTQDYYYFIIIIIIIYILLYYSCGALTQSHKRVFFEKANHLAILGSIRLPPALFKKALTVFTRVIQLSDK